MSAVALTIDQSLWSHPRRQRGAVMGTNWIDSLSYPEHHDPLPKSIAKQGPHR